MIGDLVKSVGDQHVGLLCGNIRNATNITRAPEGKEPSAALAAVHLKLERLHDCCCAARRLGPRNVHVTGRRS